MIEQSKVSVNNLPKGLLSLSKQVKQMPVYKLIKTAIETPGQSMLYETEFLFQSHRREEEVSFHKNDSMSSQNASLLPSPKSQKSWKKYKKLFYDLTALEKHPDSLGVKSCKVKQTEN